MSWPNPPPFPRIRGRRSLTCSVIPHQRVSPERREIDAHGAGRNFAATKGRSVRHLTADAAETERIGAFAAQALADIHSALYGLAPTATRAWTDEDAILLVMRLPAESAARRGDAPLSAIQRMVGAAVFRRTGVALRPAGTNVDAQRGLAVLDDDSVPIQKNTGPGRRT